MPDLDAQFRTLLAEARAEGAAEARGRHLTTTGYRREVAVAMLADILDAAARAWLRQDAEAAAIVATTSGELRSLAQRPVADSVPATPPPLPHVPGAVPVEP